MTPSLLSLLPRPPHPSRDGSAIRNYHLLEALSGPFRVRVLALRAPHLPEGEYPAGVEAREVPQSGRFSRRAAAVARSLAGEGPYPTLLYRSRELDAAVREAVAREKPSWVLAHGYHMGESALRGGGAASWVDFHNLDSDIWRRVGETATSPFARRFARLQAPRVEAVEKRLARAAGGLSCVSARDARVLRELSGRTVSVVPNGVDLGRYLFRTAAASEELLFFVGDLSWPPNAEAVRWFRDAVWPAIRDRRPRASVEILGRGAPGDLSPPGDARFRLLGEGGDTRPFWQRAAVAIVPLRAGGGTRLKILEAAACGVPVVSTPVGAEGLDFEDAEIAIASDPADFAGRVETLLADPAARARQAQAARRRVERLYDWRPIGAEFAAELLRARGAA
jgi:glycosyltransferase involved in cell wall biosynthesis